MLRPIWHWSVRMCPLCVYPSTSIFPYTAIDYYGQLNNALVVLRLENDPTFYIMRPKLPVLTPMGQSINKLPHPLSPTCKALGSRFVKHCTYTTVSKFQNHCVQHIQHAGVTAIVASVPGKILKTLTYKRKTWQYVLHAICNNNSCTLPTGSTFNRTWRCGTIFTMGRLFYRNKHTCQLWTAYVPGTGCQTYDFNIKVSTIRINAHMLLTALICGKLANPVKNACYKANVKCT